MTPKQIGTAVRKARGQRSIREVAGAAGLSRHQVTSIEDATTNYTIGSLLALAKVVGLNVEVTGRDTFGTLLWKRQGAYLKGRESSRSNALTRSDTSLAVE